MNIVGNASYKTIPARDSVPGQVYIHEDMLLLRIKFGCSQGKVMFITLHGPCENVWREFSLPVHSSIEPVDTELQLLNRTLP